MDVGRAQARAKRRRNSAVTVQRPSVLTLPDMRSVTPKSVNAGVERYPGVSTRRPVQAGSATSSLPTRSMIAMTASTSLLRTPSTSTVATANNRVRFDDTRMVPLDIE